MAYKYTSLVSRPVQQSLGLDWGDLGSGLSKVVDFFGAGIKAQGAQEALAAQLQAQQQAQAAAAAKSGGISTTTLLIGGAVVAGVLVFAMRRK